MHTNVLTASKRTRCINSTAAGTTPVNGTHVDMSGFETVIFTAAFGALTASQVTNLKAQAGNAADDSDMADLTGAVTANLADTDGNKMLVLEVFRPVGFRYVRPVVVRGTANAAIDSVVADQYGSRDQPETEDTTVSSAVVAVEPKYSNASFTVTTQTIGNTTTKTVTTARTAS